MRKASSQAGFTLIETLVALVIFVACYLLLHQGVSLGWRGVQAAHAEAAALRLAQAKLAAAGIGAPLAEGQEEGRTADGYRWMTRVRGHRPPGADEPRSRLSGYWVEVEVRWREGAWRSERTLRLATLRLGTRP